MMQVNILKKIHEASGWKNLDAAMEISKGSLTVLCGGSGAGKTSLLKMLAGILDPDSGTILVNNTLWFDQEKKINLQPQQRNIGFVFQDYALFPNMTVRRNIEFPLGSKNEKAWVDHLLELTGLSLLENRNPLSLSGGQQQRLALARALARKPSILLLDEPFSALDLSTRFQLQQELIKIHKEYNLTTLIVSHAPEEMAVYANNVFELNSNGQLEDVKQKKEQVWKGDVVSAEYQDDKVRIKLKVNNSIVEIEIPANELNRYLA